MLVSYYYLILFAVSHCSLCSSSIMSYNATIIAHNHHTDILISALKHSNFQANVLRNDASMYTPPVRTWVYDVTHVNHDR